MKREIRFRVFETNSSSVHAISVSRGDGKYAAKKYLKDCYNKTIHIEGGRFGWEFDEYYDPGPKLSYIFTMAASDGMNEFVERKDFMQKTLEGVGFVVDFQEMKEIVSKDGEYSWVEPVNDNDIYIDHSSEWTDFKEKIFSDQDFFLDVVFNNGSFILTGNDNSDLEDTDLGEMINTHENDPDFYVKWN